MEKDSLKKGILLNLGVLVICVVALIGTSYAWFTSSSSAKGNKVETGILNIVLKDEGGKPLENQTIKWESADGMDQVYWEPGATYKLTPFRIVNEGNLALKYKIKISGLTGDAKLLKVINFTYEDGSLDDLINKEMHLAPGESSSLITITGHMSEAAGNEYQGMTTGDVIITVEAAQDTLESDSYDNAYDERAEYPKDQTTGEV